MSSLNDVEGSIISQNRGLIVSRNEETKVLVANKIVRVVHRLKGIPRGVSEATTGKKRGILAKHFGVVILMQVKQPVLMPKEMSWKIHAFKRDTMNIGEPGNNTPRSIHLEEARIIMGINEYFKILKKI
jgi:hypothetical protein